jgi:MOSC domain-containing protein YiiM
LLREFAPPNKALQLAASSALQLRFGSLLAPTSGASGAHSIWPPSPFGRPAGVLPMKLLSVNVGLPREVEWRGKTVRTSIFKAPISGPVRVQSLNLQGDQQSDPSVHGGRDKAIYAYPSEHYAFWRTELPDADLPWGAFGENFTTEGLLEDRVCIGDHVRSGSAEFVVTQPRMPCFKLGIRFDRADIVKRFQRSGRTGFYLSVLREGQVTAGDPLELIASHQDRVSVADIAHMFTADAVDQDLLRRASELPALPEGWRDHFRARLWGPDA